MRLASPVCQRSRLGPLVAGSTPNKSVLGVTTAFQHIQDPEAFLLRARPILRLYEHAQSLLEQGIWVVCTDEKPVFKRRRQNKLLVQPFHTTLCTSPHATI